VIFDVEQHKGCFTTSSLRGVPLKVCCGQRRDQRLSTPESALTSEKMGRPEPLGGNVPRESSRRNSFFREWGRSATRICCRSPGRPCGQLSRSMGKREIARFAQNWCCRIAGSGQRAPALSGLEAE